MTRRHDLPPKWDDCLVTWGPWEPEPITTLGLHVTKKQRAAMVCPKCKSDKRRTRSVGMVAAHALVTREQLDDDAENRRRLGKLAYKRKRIDFVRLFAYRCPDCGHDQVHDIDTNETWDLDPDDYGDGGSLHPGDVQGALF